MAARRSRHSMAQTDPLYWARARAAEQPSDPFDDATTEELPSVAPEWSGRLPLSAPPGGLPALRPWAAEERTTDSLPVLRTDDAATTVDLPAVPSDAETVDYRDRPLVSRELVPYSSGRSAIARRGYTGRHRPPESAAPVRLGLSTAGLTAAVGVLGFALAMLHVQPNSEADRATPPLSAASPTDAQPEPVSTPATGPEPSPSPGRQLIPRPSSSSSGPPPAAADTPPVAPAAPAARGDDDTDVGEAAAPDSAGRPTRTRRPDTASRPTPTCSSRGVRMRAMAEDTTASPSATTQADPEETPDEETEEPTEEPSPSASAC